MEKRQIAASMILLSTNPTAWSFGQDGAPPAHVCHATLKKKSAAGLVQTLEAMLNKTAK